MIEDFLSQSEISPVIYSANGVYLNKNITKIYSLQSADVIGYQSLRLCVLIPFSSKEEVENNFDLVWQAYGVSDYTGNIISDSLDIVKEYRQMQNLNSFNEFLKNHPLLFSDGNYYGVEETDRNEMAQQFLSYQIQKEAGLNPTTIMWHTKKKACKELPVEDFLMLVSAITQYTLPYYNQMQERKEQIFDAEDKMTILSTPTTYGETV